MPSPSVTMTKTFPDMNDSVKPPELEFWLLNEPVPFEQLGSSAWPERIPPVPFGCKSCSEYGPLMILSPCMLPCSYVPPFTTGVKRKLSSTEYPTQERSDFQRAHQAAINFGLQAAAPSSASKLNATAKQDKSPLCNAHPPDTCGFDVRLFHPAFEDFNRQYHGAEKLANEEKTVVHNFLVRSADHYNDDKARQGAVTSSLTTPLGDRDLVGLRNTDGSSADGVITYPSARTGMRIPLLLFKLRTKWAVGTPTPQTKLDYCIAESWPCKLLPHIPTGSHGVVVVRPWRGVHRQAYRPAPDPVVVAGPRHTPKPQYREVPRLIAAPSTGILEPEKFYSRLGFELASEAQFFPYVTFTDKWTKAKAHFNCEGHAKSTNLDGNKAVFVANTEDNQKILIEFTEAYNEKAHCLPAARNLAPPPLSCDPFVSSGFAMVVMIR
ncbi:hypothetical protein BDM02DRAFT_3272811 [Thelephora ganbajun]|uniref:Uncharacterized protein n=1 Tax=Thelephora ganbajun TaxID=370292 RepID=A0ACB6Z2X4_THEGA|nr:hypothetical protein BDM02DRAFT_3272811 [Thelephora ganbajun]